MVVKNGDLPYGRIHEKSPNKQIQESKDFMVISWVIFFLWPRPVGSHLERSYSWQNSTMQNCLQIFGQYQLSAYYARFSLAWYYFALQLFFTYSVFAQHRVSQTRPIDSSLLSIRLRASASRAWEPTESHRLLQHCCFHDCEGTKDQIGIQLQSHACPIQPTHALSSTPSWSIAIAHTELWDPNTTKASFSIFGLKFEAF